MNYSVNDQTDQFVVAPSSWPDFGSKKSLAAMVPSALRLPCTRLVSTLTKLPLPQLPLLSHELPLEI